MKLLLGLFFIFTGIAYSAYNPFFDDREPVVKKASKPTSLLLLPPPLNVHQVEPLSEPKAPQSTKQMYYFGYIESGKGKYALIKVDGNNIIVKENNRVYINGSPYFVHEITSNVVVMENSTKQVKMVYFSGETEVKK